MNPLILEEIFYALTLLALPFIIHYFYSLCFGKRVESGLVLFLIYLVYYVIVLLLHLSPLPGEWLLGLNLAGIVLLSFLYQGTVQWRIGAALFLTALIVLSDVLLGPVYSTGGYILNLFLSKFLMLVWVQTTLRITKSFGDGSLNKWYWIGLFCLPFLTLLGMVHLTANLTFRENLSFIPVISGVILSVNFLIVLLGDRVLSLQAIQYKNDLLEQQNAYYINQYLLNSERQEEAFKFRHDFKHILLGLRAKWHAGELDSGLSEVDQLLSSIKEQDTESCNSGCLILDSILNYKYITAKKLGIAWHLDIHIPPNLSLNASRISIILGNTLDNAIEACSHATIDKPYVNVKAHYWNEALFIRIENPYRHKISTNRLGELNSTKTGKAVHGIGLKSVRKTIEECGGLLDLSYENQVFQIEICLFNLIIRSS
ncbi:GHKL domain-containing protein [Paenibacillus albidus]|uniref:ATP-binding protein n=1 Tax=Paenibacillus albidus TaxID=2041023 RepID=UPI001BE62028|nr:sensor histidine kinase [Paenibacillus albidus]MBT2292930.1 GHKL domain-containing protein [Paenibacillus albidus]